MSSPTRRRVAGASPPTANGGPAHQKGSAASAPAAAAPSSPNGIPRWFSLYYMTVCSSIIVGVAIWFLFVRVPYSSHVSYDPIQWMPALIRKDITMFYQRHDNASNSDANSITADMLDVFVRFQHADYFRAEALGPNAGAWDHFVEAMTAGWVAGVFEGIRLDPAQVAEIDRERAEVGSIPGGSRKLREKLSKLVSPIVAHLYDEGDPAAHAAGETDAPANPQSVALWRQLEVDNRSWVFEGLAYCDTSPCRLAKMQLVTLWRDRLALFPEHKQKEQWQTLTQLFHPDLHTEKLLDAPASATTLCTLWYRFFGSGNTAYVRRILDLTKLTGAPAYQTEKDEEVRRWYANKDLRAKEAREQHEKEVAEARKTGKTVPPPPASKRLQPLPPSPTRELHGHFFNSFLTYADGHPLVNPEGHELVKQAFREALRDDPHNDVLNRLGATTPFQASAAIVAAGGKQ